MAPAWIRNFLATNGKGYDNSRLSDDIHRGSDRFTTNGYALPVPHVVYHKMDLQWKPQSNAHKKFSHLFYMKYWSRFLQLCIASAFAYANSRHKNGPCQQRSLLLAGPEIKITPAKGAYALSHKNWHKIYIKSKGWFLAISKKVNLILS